jgi:hypothetical protein
MRTGVRVSPSWLGGFLRSRIRCSRLIIGPLEKSLADGAGHTFFERLDDPLILRRMARSCADMGEADLLQKRPDIALVEVDAEPLGDDTLKIDTPPAHDAVFLALRASLEDLRKLRQLLVGQARLRTFGPVVEKPVRTRGVESVNPVAKRLAVHATDPRGRPSVHSVSNPGQRQKPSARVDIPRPAGEPTQRLRRIVLSQSDR